MNDPLLDNLSGMHLEGGQIQSCCVMSPATCSHHILSPITTLWATWWVISFNSGKSKDDFSQWLQVSLSCLHFPYSAVLPVLSFYCTHCPCPGWLVQISYPFVLQLYSAELMNFKFFMNRMSPNLFVEGKKKEKGRPLIPGIYNVVILWMCNCI